MNIFLHRRRVDIAFITMMSVFMDDVRCGRRCAANVSILCAHDTSKGDRALIIDDTSWRLRCLAL